MTISKTMVEMIKNDHLRKASRVHTDYDNGFIDALDLVLITFEMDHCEVLDGQEV